MPQLGWGVIAGAAVALMGSFLPWFTASTGFASVSIDGMSGDGKLTAVLAVVGVGLAIGGMTKREGGMLIAAIAVFGVGLAVAIYDWSRASSKASDLSSGDIPIVAQVGYGLYACIIGAAVGGVCSALELRRKF